MQHSTLVGKTIVISGGSSGIGLELVKRLQAENQLIVIGRDKKKLAELEVQNQVLARQNSLNEDIISELNNKAGSENTSGDAGGMGPRMPKLVLAHDSSKVAG